jgi:hypothetical protein
LSAPLLFALGYAVVVALVDYRTALQFDDWWSQEQRLERFLTGRLRTAALLPKAVSLRNRMDPEADDAHVMRLRVSRDEWEGEVADPFVSDPVWIDATLIRNGSLSDVRVRRRGDTSVHWTTPKVSFTLRTPKEAHVRGFRDLALSGKEVLSSHIANTMPVEFDIPTPFSAVVPVFLNEQYYGLFRAVEPVDESFLRRVGRMPGNVFRADLAERGEYFKNVPRNVFINPYIWDRTAVNDVPGTQPFTTLRSFLEAVNGSTFDEHVRLLSFVDRDEVARLLAAMLVVGDPYHMSGSTTSSGTRIRRRVSSTRSPGTCVSWTCRRLEAGSTRSCEPPSETPSSSTGPSLTCTPRLRAISASGSPTVWTRSPLAPSAT